MAEEVRIVAVLDTTDITNGVQRTANAARQIKQVWEQSTAVGFPREKIESDMDALRTVAADKGAETGRSFFQGFVGRLLIRDAIYGMIRGLGEAIKAAQTNLEQLAGVKPTNLTLWQEFTRWIGTTASLLISLSPAVNTANVRLAESGLASVRAQNTQDLELEKYREHPELLTTPAATIENQIQGAIEQRGKAREAAAEQHILAAAGGDSTGLKDIDDRLKDQEKYLEAQEQFYREMLSIAKERDRKNSSEDKTDEKADQKAAASIEEANEFMAGRIRDEEASDTKKEKEAADKAERDQAEHDKKLKEHQLTLEAQTDSGEEGRKGVEKNLDFAKKELEHQKATSVVSIGGQLFGRNDSAIQLVNYAARQLGKLDSIDAELKAIRQERSELTLL